MPIEPAVPILTIRTERVILDADLARLYGVETRALNQAVKRNTNRFPEDFLFQLNQAEKTEVITNCDHLHGLRFSKSLPFAFTEHGALMAANVLNSPGGCDDERLHHQGLHKGPGATRNQLGDSQALG